MPSQAPGAFGPNACAPRKTSYITGSCDRGVCVRSAGRVGGPDSKCGGRRSGRRRRRGLTLEACHQPVRAGCRRRGFDRRRATMKIHEYRAKNCWEVRRRRLWFPLRIGGRCREGGRELSGKIWVVKAQITPAAAAGRRRRWPVHSLEKLRQHANDILGMQLVTHQTGPEGRRLRNLLIEEGADIATSTTSRRADRPCHPDGRHDGFQRRRHGHRGSRHSTPRRSSRSSSTRSSA